MPPPKFLRWLAQRPLRLWANDPGDQTSPSYPVHRQPEPTNQYYLPTHGLVSLLVSNPAGQLIATLSAVPSQPSSRPSQPTWLQDFDYVRAVITFMNFKIVSYLPLPTLAVLHRYVHFPKNLLFKNPDFCLIRRTQRPDQVPHPYSSR